MRSGWIPNIRILKIVFPSFFGQNKMWVNPLLVMVIFPLFYPTWERYRASHALCHSQGVICLPKLELSSLLISKTHASYFCVLSTPEGRVPGEGRLEPWAKMVHSRGPSPPLLSQPRGRVKRKCGFEPDSTNAMLWAPRLEASWDGSHFPCYVTTFPAE